MFDSLWSRFESSEDARPERSDVPDNERRFRTLFDHSADSLFLLDLDGTIVDVNARACARLGYAPADLLGRNISKFEERAPGQPVSTKDSLEPDRIAIHEAHHVHADGQRIPVQVRTGILVMDGTPRVLASATDVRDRDALEAQVRQYQRMEAVSRLAGGIAHDFNNALTAILTHAEFMLEELPADSATRTDAEAIQSAARRVSTWTQQLLALSSDPVHESDVIDANELVRDTLPMLQRVAGDRVGVDIGTVEGPIHVRATAGQLSQILLNLADNARDAMPGGGTIRVRTGRVTLADGAATLPAIAPGEYATVKVEDDGYGMDPETAAHVFEPFFTTKTGGSGMGLAVVYGLVARAGGGVHLDTRQGGGARITLYLPSVPAPRVTASRPPAPVPTDVTGTETILIVEDDEAIRVLAQRALARLGYHTLTARDAGQALVLYNRYREKIHLLITDVVMPNMSGGELVRRLEALGADLKVLYMTGYTDDVLVQNGIERDEAALLRKPFTPEPLAVKVRQVLDGNLARPLTQVAARQRLLIVDDDSLIRRSLRRILRDQDVVEAASVAEARAALGPDARYDAILCDVRLPDGTGLDLHRWLVEHGHPMSAHMVLVSGGFNDPADVAYVRKTGLSTLEKPFSTERLRQVVARITAPSPS